MRMCVKSQNESNVRCTDHHGHELLYAYAFAAGHMKTVIDID